MVQPFRPSFNPVGPKPVRGLDRITKRKDADQRMRDAYALVDARDHGLSVVTGIHTIPGSPDPRLRREHHHLRGRNVAPEWRYDAARICTVTALEHQLLHAGALLVEGDDASQRLVFTWSRDLVPRGTEPFLIRSRRRSFQISQGETA